MLSLLALAFLAYFLGSVNPAYILGKKLRGLDLREAGSGNPGVSNVFRTMGKWPAILTGLYDILKGFVPVLVGRLLGLEPFQYMLVGIAAVAGHNWPIFMGFSGGRGMSTSFGATAALAPLPTLIFTITFLAGVYLFKGIGLVMVITFTFLPLWAFLAGEPWGIVYGLLGLVALVMLRRSLGNKLRPPQVALRVSEQRLWQTVMYRVLFDRDTRRVL